MGMKDKIELGPWFRPAFSALYKMRRVRGTRLDVFGYAEVRRVERELVKEYRGVIDDIARRLDATSLPLAVEIAELPDLVRGYEHIKLAGVEEYHRRLDELQSRLP
jgi:indolepyruvate ferredoxin oxidoreductase